MSHIGVCIASTYNSIIIIPDDTQNIGNIRNLILQVPTKAHPGHIIRCIQLSFDTWRSYDS